MYSVLNFIDLPLQNLKGLSPYFVVENLKQVLHTGGFARVLAMPRQRWLQKSRGDRAFSWQTRYHIGETRAQCVEMTAALRSLCSLQRKTVVGLGGHGRFPEVPAGQSLPEAGLVSQMPLAGCQTTSAGPDTRCGIRQPSARCLPIDEISHVNYHVQSLLTATRLLQIVLQIGRYKYSVSPFEPFGLAFNANTHI